MPCYVIKVEEGAAWVCAMHPEPRLATCDAPEEVEYADHFQKASGYAARPTDLGDGNLFPSSSFSRF